MPGARGGLPTAALGTGLPERGFAAVFCAAGRAGIVAQGGCVCEAHCCLLMANQWQSGNHLSLELLLVAELRQKGNICG